MTPRERVHLPVDFDGPICAKCVHVRKSKPDNLPTNGHNWQCTAGEPEVLSPAELNPITGLVHAKRFKHRPLCKDRNEHGECQDYKAANL